MTYLTKKEREIESKYLEQGYVIQDVENVEALAWIRNCFTNIIKQNSIEIKKDIIEHLWKVIISDNSIDQYEANLMRRICGLIYFPDKDCAEIKLRLTNSK